MDTVLAVLLGISLAVGVVNASCGKMDSPGSYRCAAREELFRAKQVTHNKAIAKNLVLFIGDGMGLPTVTAGRVFQGQRMGQTGEEYKLFFETFPSVGLSKTYNSDRQVPDSAGTATAMYSGVKANYGTLGVDNRVPYGKDCSKMVYRTKVKTVLDYAVRSGKSVGIVTNARITHATPAAAYAHLPYRYWESDTNMKDATRCDDVKDVALQLVEDNPNIKVILGGGRRSFLNNTTPDPRTGEINSNHRTDNRSLIEEWIMDKQQRGKRYRYVETKGELNEVNPNKTEFLLGLFSSSHMTYETERDSSANGEPSLTEMVEKAIDVLKTNPKGYLLIAEGARIDHAHHKNEAKRALVEVAEFDRAIMTAQSKTGHSDTLTVVTADHSHVFAMAGYPERGNPILGLGGVVDDNEKPVDGMPYLTLTYANGPEAGRYNLTGVNTTTSTFRFPSCVEMPWETHGGEDVAIYAIGPMSHMFHTTHEQHYIAHVLQYAACIGEYSTDITCDRPLRVYNGNGGGGGGNGDNGDNGGGNNGHGCDATRIFAPLSIVVCVLLRCLFMS